MAKHGGIGANSRKTGLTLLLAAVSLGILFPLFLSFVVAIKNPEEMSQGILTLPASPHWDNFLRAMQKTDFVHALANSLTVTAIATFLTLITNSVVAYAIARNWHHRFFRFLYYYFLSAMFIPFPVIMLPIVKQMAFIGGDNILGLIFLYVIYGLPFNTFVYVGYLRGIPVDMEEAARIDGAGSFRIFRKIIFPIMLPINATVGILTALWVWNDFMLPLVILSDKRQYTLPLMQYVFQTQFSADYNLAFASYFLVMIPIILIYLFAQKWIIRGVMGGALKG